MSQPKQPADLHIKRLSPMNVTRHATDGLISRAEWERADTPHGTPELDRRTLNLPPDAGRDPKARLARRWESEA